MSLMSVDVDDMDNNESKRSDAPPLAAIPDESNTNAQISFGWNPGNPTVSANNGGNTDANNTDTNANDNTTNNNEGVFRFGTIDTNNIANDNNDGGGFQFGAPDNTTSNISNDNNNHNGGFQFGAPDNTNNANNSNTNDGGGWLFNASAFTSGANGNTEQSNAAAQGDPPTSQFTFGTNASTTDPFAAYNSSQSQSQSEMQTDSQDSQEAEQPEQQRPVGPPPPPPQINEEDIDQEAMQNFLRLYSQQTQSQWACQACSVLNPTADCFKCTACEAPRPGFTGDEGDDKDEHQAQAANEKDERCMRKKLTDTRLDRSYFDVLSKNNEYLEYHPNFHPKPRYFPYQHEQWERELEDEGPLTGETWQQFNEADSEDDGDDNEDDDDDDNDDDDDGMSPSDQNSENNAVPVAANGDVVNGDVVNGESANGDGSVSTPGGDEEEQTQEDEKHEDEKDEDEDKRVTVYREYKRRRLACKQQIDGVHRRLESGHRMVAVTGTGDMSGVLGVGNGSVSTVPGNQALFPFILESLLDKSIKLVAAGPQTSAAVTVDDEIFVWGSNDHAQLTIDPLNPRDIDVGDEDNQLDASLQYERLFAHYEQAITAVYEQHNPEKLQQQPHFVATQLAKQKMGKVTLHVGDIEKTFDDAIVVSDSILERLMQHFILSLRVKPSKKVAQKTEVAIDMKGTSKRMHGLYKKICAKYNMTIPESMRKTFVPKASAQELLARKEKKLNPYRYLQRRHSAEHSNRNNNRRHHNRHNHNHHNGGHNGHTDNGDDGDVSHEYHYEQKESTGDEDAFQKDISCVYYTPAQIRLPCKCVVQQVTLGGSHMVVLDALGRVFSSGTFLNESVPVGHHYNHELKQIVRYQRTLTRITDIDLMDDNSQYKQLPLIKHIASGLNHFLMLDEKGDIWSMGITKMGQRWNSRLTKQYLCPRRIAVINQTQKCRTKRRVRFSKVACGTHHNVALSEHGHLFTWGNNNRLQCGHSHKYTGYGDSIDHPRYVTFWEHKDFDDDDAEDVAVTDYEIVDVVAGEHMTVALDRNGRVWSCGRNACLQLGRSTKWDGYKNMNGVMVKQEVREDLMRMVTDLKHLEIDWIGCGPLVWHAHNKANGTVYAYGDAVNGRAGVGYWKSGARGRPVFDEYNLDLTHYKVVGCQGGAEHMMLLLEKKAKAHTRRQSVLIAPSVEPMEEEQHKTGDRDEQQKVIVDESSNHSSSSTHSKKIVPATHHVPHVKVRRKRRHSEITPDAEMADIPEANTLDEESEQLQEKVQPKRKKQKLCKSKTSTVRSIKKKKK